VTTIVLDDSPDTIAAVADTLVYLLAAIDDPKIDFPLRGTASHGTGQLVDVELSNATDRSYPFVIVVCGRRDGTWLPALMRINLRPPFAGCSFDR